MKHEIQKGVQIFVTQIAAIFKETGKTIISKI
jgi:hypothetical protein